MNTESTLIPLEEFVKSALTDIARGVQGAADPVNALGGEVNPAPYGENRDLATSGVCRAVGGDVMTFVSFDVAVTAVRAGDRDSGIRVAFAGIEAGIGENNKKSFESASRISFKIPIRLPRK
jgi:hypothetical protein